MSRCDWCGNLVGVRHYIETDGGLKDVTLCAVCHETTKSVADERLYEMEQGYAAHASLHPYRTSGSVFGLMNWLVPRILD